MITTRICINILENSKESDKSFKKWRRTTLITEITPYNAVSLCFVAFSRWNHEALPEFLTKIVPFCHPGASEGSQGGAERHKQYLWLGRQIIEVSNNPSPPDSSSSSSGRLRVKLGVRYPFGQNDNALLFSSFVMPPARWH